jgi:uncharacterized metal-binding protein YceD (DUF177 family)
MMIPEFHRPTATDRIPVSGMTLEVVADAAELPTIAERLQLPAVESLSCRYVLSRPLASGTRRREGEIVADCVLRAKLVRECVVSLDPFDVSLEERFRVRFVPAGTESDDEDPEADDEIGYEGAAIDLGEAAVEQLALTLDPYPRKPGAQLPPEASDAEENPFAALGRLVRPD